MIMNRTIQFLMSGQVLLILFTAAIDHNLFTLAGIVSPNSDIELTTGRLNLTKQGSPAEKKARAWSPPRIVLHSPETTNWGEWGDWDRCLPGMFVHEMKLKTEKYQGAISDDTALNGIRFFCAPPGKAREYSYKIESDVGERGSWGNVTSCPGIVVGFQLRSLKDQGPGDDTGATNLRILCESPLFGYLTYVEGDGLEWGEWSKEQKCPANHAVCGLQTQIEKFRGVADATGLNNLKVECCLKPKRN